MARDTEIRRLAEMQDALCALIAPLDESECRVQFHPDLSPLAWHPGHTTFIENQWLRETILGDDSATAPVRDLYLPQNARKSRRGMRLPPKDALLDDCLRMQRDNRTLLEDPPPTLAAHRLMQDDYLLKFLAQHHAMHLETMHMALTEKQLQQKARGYRPKTRLEPAAVRLQPVAFDGGEVEIGGTDTWCFDNELPRHRKTLRDFALNATPATNAEFLGFIESGGYDNLGWWDAAGRRWLEKTGAKAPHHWLNDDTGAWYGADSRGCHDLAANEPVHGLSRHEACAFARCAGARLPHESEWETAHLQDPAHERIRSNDCAWEWCDNAFHPYPDFKPFPYDEYSTPWFNNAHYVLRGHSRHTPDVLRRSTFRNFYTADKRHIFAGVRVAMV